MNQPTLPAPVQWPEPQQPPASSNIELEKIRYQALVDEQKMRLQAMVDEVKAAWRDRAAAVSDDAKRHAEQEAARDAAEDALREAIQDAYLEVAKGAYARVFERGKFTVAAAGAIGTLYTGLLGLVYSASAGTTTGNVPNPLPPVGMAPAFFLGLSLMLSAFYVSFAYSRAETGFFLPTGTGPNMQEERMLTFIKWTASGARQRAWALRTSVVCLGIGLVLTPLPFLQVPETGMWMVVGTGVSILVLDLAIELANYGIKRSRSKGKDDE